MGLFNRSPREPQDPAVAFEAPQLGAEPATDELGRRSLGDHSQYVLGVIQPLAPFGMSLMDAWGHTLCEDLKAYGDVPPVPVAEVDGFGIYYGDWAARAGAHPVFALVDAPRRAGDLMADAPIPEEEQVTTQITVSSEQPTPPRSVLVGYAIRVWAGEELPDGVDTVLSPGQVVLDDTGRYITVLSKVAEGDWVRPPLAEATDGALVLAAGTELDARHSALLAAVGFGRVMVRPRTRVAAVQVVDTSGEVPFNGGRAPGVGLHLINGAAQADGATVYRVEVDLAALEASRERLSDELIRADLVLTIGGMTDEGIDPRLVTMLNDMGVVNVCEVAVKPGRLHGVGLIGDEFTPVVMLPSDPTALLVAYHAFARPALRKLMGAEPFEHEPILCFAERDLDAELGVTQLIPVRLRQAGNRYMASEITSRTHSWLTTLVAADALVVLPPNRQRVYTGEALACWLLGDALIAAE